MAAPAHSTLSRRPGAVVPCARSCRLPCPVVFKGVSEQTPDLNRVLAGHELAPKRRLRSGLIGIGREMFPRMAKSGALPELAHEPIEMFERGLAALHPGRLRRGAAVVEGSR